MNFLSEKSDSETFCLFAFLMDLSCVTRERPGTSVWHSSHSSGPNPLQRNLTHFCSCVRSLHMILFYILYRLVMALFLKKRQEKRGRGMRCATGLITCLSSVAVHSSPPSTSTLWLKLLSRSGGSRSRGLRTWCNVAFNLFCTNWFSLCRFFV